MGRLNMNNNELKHYGVKGMRWGDRKHLYTYSKYGKNSSDALRTASNTVDQIGIGKKPSRKQRREMSKMSDAELRARINRMDMERRYAELNPSKTARGAQTAKTILSVVGGVAAIGGSVASIALAYQTLKEGKVKIKD